MMPECTILVPLALHASVRETEGVEGYCTCGARLPEDARFCHKCGRPLFEETVVEEEQPPVPLPPPVVQAPPLPDIGFRNAVAVRTGFFVASLALAGNMLAALSGSVALYLLAALVFTPASGFFAVWLYSKRTGRPLSVRSGAKLGFITGVFGFVFSTVLSTLSTISVASRTGIAEQYRQQLDRQGLPPEAIEQVNRMLESPSTIALIMLLGMAVTFLFGTVTASVGGAIGAKVLEKD